MGKPVVPGGAGGAMAHLDFGRSFNSISTKGGRLCPSISTGTPGFSNLPTALVATGLILSWPIASGVFNLTESGKKIMF